jgi:hypothetical protein
MEGCRVKGVEINVQIGPYEAGSMTLGPGAVHIEVRADDILAAELKEAVREIVYQTIQAKALGGAVDSVAP